MFQHPDDYETDLRPYCYMRAGAEASNFESGHALSCADGAGGDCTCGLINRDDELMDYPEMYDFPITLEMHLISLAALKAIEDYKRCECGAPTSDYPIHSQGCIPF